jgi:hypothetical protein
VEDPPAKVHHERIGSRRMAAAMVELARSRRRLAQLPTMAQVRTMARFEGREPCSYLPDPQANFVPELMFGYERASRTSCGGALARATSCASPEPRLRTGR